MSRYRGNVSKSRIRKESKTIPIWGHPIRGDGLDSGKWFRCWNCGMPNHIDRDALGDSQSRDGVVLTDYSQAIAGGKDEARLGNSLVASVNDSEGNSKEVRYALMISESSYGCRFCHSLNYRGDY